MSGEQTDEKGPPRSSPGDWFPRSVLWRSFLESGEFPAWWVREGGPEAPPPPRTERLLQCVWFDPALRPSLRTAEGEPVRVISPGRWNLEAGPDFLGAALELGPERRRISGDVEAHLRPGDWEAHGHGADPRYRNVRAHVTYWPGPAPESLPRAAVRIALRDALATVPRFDFDRIDPSAYPYAVRIAPCPCAAKLAGWPPGRRIALLESAGEERLRRKAERIGRAVEERGEEQVFYEETFAALGYRNNKGVFRCLAERLPIEELRLESGGDPETGYAVLAGFAGLLPETPASTWDAETRRWIRRLWDIWWKRSVRWSGRCLEKREWVLSGFRPSNHPLRRLAAAAWLFAGRAPLLPALRTLVNSGGAGGVRNALDRLCEPAGGYWARRLTVGGEAQSHPVALLGRARAAAIFNNALLPLCAARDDPANFRSPWASILPAEGEAGILRMTATALFGPDVPPSLIRPPLRRMGLLQIFQDFCLQDRSDCLNCEFPKRLERDS